MSVKAKFSKKSASKLFGEVVKEIAMEYDVI